MTDMQAVRTSGATDHGSKDRYAVEGAAALDQAVARTPSTGRLYDAVHVLARRYGLRAGVYLANFGVAKAAAFLGPLLLARMLASGLYGDIELSWSTGNVAATVLTLGIPSALPQLLLLRRPVPAADLIAAAIAGLSVLALVLILILAAAGAPASAVLIVSCAALAVGQTCLSAYSRTRSHRNAAVWLDGLATHVVAVAVLVLSMQGAVSLRGTTVVTTVAVVLLAIGSCVAIWRFRAADFTARLRTAVRLGLPLLLYSLCSIWVVISGRIYIGAILGAQDLAAYSVSFRVGSAIFLFHAIQATALFPHLYRMHTRRYDRYLAIYLLLIALLCIVLMLLYPLILDWLALRAVDATVRSQTISVFPIVMLQIFGWATWALLELRVSRARRGAQAAWRTLAVFALFGMLIAGLGWMNALSLQNAAWLATARDGRRDSRAAARAVAARIQDAADGGLRGRRGSRDSGSWMGCGLMAINRRRIATWPERTSRGAKSAFRVSIHRHVQSFGCAAGRQRSFCGHRSAGEASLLPRRVP